MQTKYTPRRIFAASLLALTLGGVMTTPAFAATSTNAKTTKMATKKKKKHKKMVKTIAPAVVTTKAATPAVVTTKKA